MLRFQWPIPSIQKQWLRGLQTQELLVVLVLALRRLQSANLKAGLVLEATVNPVLVLTNLVASPVANLVASPVARARARAKAKAVAVAVAVAKAVTKAKAKAKAVATTTATAMATAMAMNEYLKKEEAA
jgi:hypothetical protein